MEQQLDEYKGEQQKNVAQMSELGTERDQLTSQNTELEERIVDLSLQKNMVNPLSLCSTKSDFLLQMILTLSEKQTRAKYYEQIKEGKYVKVHRTPDALDEARENQINRLQHFQTILHGLSEQCPQFRRQVTQIQTMLRERLGDQLARPSSSQ